MKYIHISKWKWQWQRELISFCITPNLSSPFGGGLFQMTFSGFFCFFFVFSPSSQSPLIYFLLVSTHFVNFSLFIFFRFRCYNFFRKTTFPHHILVFLFFIFIVAVVFNRVQRFFFWRGGEPISKQSWKNLLLQHSCVLGMYIDIYTHPH